MKIVSVVAPRPLDACWRAFLTPAIWITWVPGLRSAHVLELTAERWPRVIRCEYAGDVSYTLVYSYDLEAHVVRWAPRVGDRGGVRGFARFEAIDESTRLVYAIEHDGTRTSFEAELDDPQSLVDAFVRSMEET